MTSPRNQPPVISGASEGWPQYLTDSLNEHVHFYTKHPLPPAPEHRHESGSSPLTKPYHPRKGRAVDRRVDNHLRPSLRVEAPLPLTQWTSLGDETMSRLAESSP